MEVDDVDLAMLDILRHEGRIPVSDLARRAHISRGNVHARLNRLRDAGILEGFSARINSRRLGLDIAAFVKIKADQLQWGKVTEGLAAIPEIEYAVATTGEFDALVLVRVPSLEVLRDVVIENLHRVPGVESTETFLALEEMIRRPGVLPERAGDRDGEAS